MALEAGREYYSLESRVYGGLKQDTILTRHSKEFVVFEAAGAYFSDWSLRR